MHEKRAPGWTVALLLAILLLGLLSLFLWKTDVLSRMGDLEQLRDYIQSFEPWSLLVFFLFQLSSVIIAPIPSNMMAMAGGMCFGFWRGAVVTFLAVNLGSATTFLLARTLGQRWVERLVSRKLSGRYRRFLERKRDTFLLLAFLFPFFPDDLLCILAGVTEIPVKRFFLIVLLARPWGLFAAAALGASLELFPSWALPLVGIGGVLLFAAGLKYGDKVEAAILQRLGK